MPRLVVAGYYGFGNAGDEAILESTIASLRREIPDAQFTVLTADPEGTRAAHDIAVAPRFSVGAVLKALRSADMFLFGGGSLLQDVTSLRSLVYYLALLLAAQAMGKPTMIYANGFGPVESRIGKALTRYALNRTSAITLRDSDSARQLEAIGVNKPFIKVTADPVFALDPPEHPETDSVLGSLGVDRGARPLIGVSIRPWPGAPGFKDAVATALDMMQDDLGATAVFLPLQQSADAPLAREVASRMRRPAAVLDRALTPAQWMACMGEMDVIVGMRLHALIFGVASGVPVAGIPYDPKVHSFLDAAGCPSAGRPDELTPSSLYETVKGLLEQSQAVRESLRARRDLFRSLAQENARIARLVLPGAKSGAADA